MTSKNDKWQDLADVLQEFGKRTAKARNGWMKCQQFFFMFISLLYFLLQTENLIQRLEKILSVPGTVAEKQLFITEVILPEVS